MYRVVRSQTGVTHALASRGHGDGAREEPRTVCGRFLTQQWPAAATTALTCRTCAWLVEGSRLIIDDDGDLDLYTDWWLTLPVGYQPD